MYSGKRDVAASPASAKWIRTINNTSPTTHLQVNKMMPSLAAYPSQMSRGATTKRRVLAALSPLPHLPGHRSRRRGRNRYAAWRRRLPGSFSHHTYVCSYLPTVPSSWNWLEYREPLGARLHNGTDTLTSMDLRCGAGPRDAPRYPRHPIRALCSRVLKKLPKDGARVGG